MLVVGVDGHAVCAMEECGVDFRVEAWLAPQRPSHDRLCNAPDVLRQQMEIARSTCPKAYDNGEACAAREAAYGGKVELVFADPCGPWLNGTSHRLPLVSGQAQARDSDKEVSDLLDRS